MTTTSGGPDANEAPAGPRRNQHPPSSPLYGLLLLVALFGSAAFILTYTLLPLPGQRDLGGWNYVAAAVGVLVAIMLIKRWHPATFDVDPEVKPRFR